MNQRLKDVEMLKLYVSTVQRLSMAERERGILPPFSHKSFMNYDFFKEKCEIIINLAMEIIDECTELDYSIDENYTKFRGEDNTEGDMVQEMPKMRLLPCKEKRTQTIEEKANTDLSMQRVRLPVFRLSQSYRNAKPYIKCKTTMRDLNE